MTKINKISDAQARRLCELWGGLRYTSKRGEISYRAGYGNSTDDALVRKGFLVPTGDTEIYPNGAVGEIHRIDPRATHAVLAEYFAKLSDSLEEEDDPMDDDR